MLVVYLVSLARPFPSLQSFGCRLWNGLASKTRITSKESIRAPEARIGANSDTA